MMSTQSYYLLNNLLLWCPSWATTELLLVQSVTMIVHTELIHGQFVTMMSTLSYYMDNLLPWCPHWASTGPGCHHDCPHWATSRPVCHNDCPHWATTGQLDAMDVQTELLLVYLAEDMSTLIQYWRFLSLLRITIQCQFLALATSTVMKVYI